jgi:hypothetical protein
VQYRDAMFQNSLLSKAEAGFGVDAPSPMMAELNVCAARRMKIPCAEDAKTNRVTRTGSSAHPGDLNFALSAWVCRACHTVL